MFSEAKADQFSGGEGQTSNTARGLRFSGSRPPASAASEWLKAAVLSPWIYGAVAGYLGAFVTWMTLLKHAPVGPAFAASHLEVVTVLIV